MEATVGACVLRGCGGGRRKGWGGTEDPMSGKGGQAQAMAFKTLQTRKLIDLRPNGIVFLDPLSQTDLAHPISDTDGHG